MPERDTFLNGDRTAELWTAIKTALAGKVDNKTLEEYAPIEGVATAIATALADYMTADEVKAAIAGAVVSASGVRFEAVDELPEAGEINVIYLVPNGQTGSNVKDEYMWIDSKWELLGSTEANLTNYWSKDELSAMTADELKAILV